MVKKTVDLDSVINPDTLASSIANKYDEWNRMRKAWLDEKAELRNYLYATDTKTTSNNKNGWSNSTTRPKLTQISDNLHANYFYSLFPSANWLKWKPYDKAAAAKGKSELVTAYMHTKLDQSNFEDTVAKLLSDFIIYGNCFASVVYERDYASKTTPREDIPVYIGPRIVRISPNDIVFDPTAAHFSKSPKIIRSILSLGEVQQMINQNPDDEGLKKVFSKMLYNRKTLVDSSDIYKGEGYVADGFNSITEYYNSGSVEVLTFYGTMFDTAAGELHNDKIITVVDRSYVISNEENPSWLGHDNIFHAGWRERPDNLYAMGPLDNLVGLQYRIDHLENLKADVFDQIAAPMYKIRGDVEEWKHEPWGRIYLGDEGDVIPMSPDATALNADLQIANLEATMEEMAGAPKQAMGIRTPGEKTAFEVQTLDNAAGRIFRHKTAHFERVFLEPILNSMLEIARRSLDTQETVMDTDKDGITIFPTITKEDIVGKGRIKPVGARHFAERALRLQNLQQLWSIKQGDPTIGVHISGKELARILSDELGEKEIYGDNIAVIEQQETQAVGEEAAVDSEESSQLMEQAQV